MRVWVISVFFVAACSSTVHELKPGKPPSEKAAMLAGHMSFSGTKIKPLIRLRRLDGKKVVLKPKHATFLVAVPPGTYRLERFGAYEPAVDQITLDAEVGRARYIGTFHAARDEFGDLKVFVSDDMWTVAEELVDRYGPELPQMEPGLLRSELPPVEGTDLSITVRRVRSSHVPFYLAIGLGFGYGFYGGHKGYHGHHGRPGHGGSRPSHSSRGSTRSRR